ncbi:hypothetical protein F4778DRAFT_798186 [Xylariomycetidae sp. FL2044]|nr:hypothetical protein F4778DRAFT_798186 [Xylariomycetidae sp. FL2044]
MPLHGESLSQALDILNSNHVLFKAILDGQFEDVAFPTRQAKVLAALVKVNIEDDAYTLMRIGAESEPARHILWNNIQDRLSIIRNTYMAARYSNIYPHTHIRLDEEFRRNIPEVERGSLPENVSDNDYGLPLWLRQGEYSQTCTRTSPRQEDQGGTPVSSVTDKFRTRLLEEVGIRGLQYELETPEAAENFIARVKELGDHINRDDHAQVLGGICLEALERYTKETGCIICIAFQRANCYMASARLFRPDLIPMVMNHLIERTWLTPWRQLCNRLDGMKGAYASPVEGRDTGEKITRLINTLQYLQIVHRCDSRELRPAASGPENWRSPAPLPRFHIADRIHSHPGLGPLGEMMNLRDVIPVVRPAEQQGGRENEAGREDETGTGGQPSPRPPSPNPAATTPGRPPNEFNQRLVLRLLR